MTNEPNYAEQKEILKQYSPWGGNITLPDHLPGTVGKFFSLDCYHSRSVFCSVVDTLTSFLLLVC